jgi:hypothetical protein
MATLGSCVVISVPECSSAVPWPSSFPRWACRLPGCVSLVECVGCGGEARNPKTPCRLHASRYLPAELGDGGEVPPRGRRAPRTPEDTRRPSCPAKLVAGGEVLPRGRRASRTPLARQTKTPPTGRIAKSEDTLWFDVRPRATPPRSRGEAPVSGSRLSSYRPGTKDSRGRILKRHFRGDVPRPQHAPVYFRASSSRAARYRGISGPAQTLEAERGVLRPRNVPF